jgi:hypothetical protein
MTDGTILFAAAGTEPILRVSSDGLQQRTPVTKLYPSESSHRFPQWFPDGRQFLYQAVATDAERRGVYVGRTDGSESTRVLGAGWSAAVLAPVQRQLLAVRNGELIAHDIDLSTGKLTGGLPKKVAENVPVDPILYAPISASAGHLAYRSGAPGRRQLTSVNRDGTEPQRVGEPDTSAEENPTIDRTGRVGVQRIIGLGIDIWLLGGSSEPRQLTFATGFPPGSYVRSHPVFSPDGRRIVLSLIPASVGAADLYVVPSTGTKGGERLLKTDGFTVASDWSYPEGRYLLYTMLNPRTGRDVWALPMSPDGLKDGEPIPVARSIASEQDAQFVLDGRFVAYQTNRSRREEIVLKSFTGKDDREIPVGTGTLPRWSRQKGELIYLAPDGYLYAVSIRMAANGQDADIGQRTRLFDTRVGGVPTDRLAIYPGGDRFLLRPLLDATQSPITVILNWNPNP